ncbi:MAG TPA: type II CRISPR RNA-guided endonuclease Cas9 [Terracidiphilus sp.]|jgi:CRISPR-associated endonuclease Csn1
MRKSEFVLGLDLGVTSIGWALADLEERRIEAAGVRIFEAPMDTAKFEAGEPGGSRAVKRRKSIHQGRQIARRKARHRDLYIALQDWDLLPFAGRKAERRHEVLTELDKTLNSTWREKICEKSPEIADPGQILCYYLRATALIAKLEPLELGRALYHLGQRRGFKSNRKEARSALNAAESQKDEKERSRIKQAIKTLQNSLDETDNTLAQHLSFVNPHISALRNRKRSDIAAIWTERKMFKQELDRIWSAQQVHYPSVLTPERKRRLENLMFWQRKVRTGKPGNCELERTPPLPRAPRSSLLAQHFRLVQTLNNLRVRENAFAEYRRLSREERDSLLLQLSTEITKTKNKKPPELFGLRFSDLKERLRLNRTAKFNLDDNEESQYLRGNRTNAIMARAFGAEQWGSFPDQKKRSIVRRWISESYPEKLLEIAKTCWSLTDSEALQLASLEPEDGYAALSHVAMLKLLPLMESECLSYSEAVARVYDNCGQELEYLPWVEEVLPQIPNPVVKRTLSEMRKVVNAIIRRTGTPKQIRIELARDLKRNAEQRARYQDQQKTRTQERATARKWLNDIGERINGDSIEKALLYMRCKVCLYCGNPLGSLQHIFSESSGVQIEHVLPRRIHDDSFSNKVLAHHACNSKKGDRTPFQAFEGTADWDDMIVRVACLRDEPLLNKFKMTEEQLAEFSNRHLADTRYISKLATEYAEKLYGGRDAVVPWEDRNRRCVYASSGVLTANLRKRWGLNAVLKDTYSNENGTDAKARTDHRHHAIDAIVIALTTESMIQQASIDSQRHDRASGFLAPRYFTPPWPRVGDVEDQVVAFRREIRDVINEITVSHRVDHKLNGQIHEETFYSPKVDGQRFVYSRVPVFEFTLEQIEDQNNKIAPEIREALRDHFYRIGCSDPTVKIRQFEKDVPYLEKNGRRIFIRRVLKAVAASSVQTLDRRKGQPSVKLGENHHFVILEHTNDDEEAEWYTPGAVSRFEVMRKRDAARRAGMKQPYSIVEKSDGPKSRYVMHLMKGDAVEMLNKITDTRDIYICTSFSDGDYAFLRHNVSVPSPKSLNLTLSQLRKKMNDNGDRVRISLEKMRQWGCRKVELDHLGHWKYCHD